KRVLRPNDLRGGDGHRGRGRGRRAGVQRHRRGHGRGPAGVAVRSVSPAARRVRTRPPGDRGGAEDRATLGAARPPARRIRESDAHQVTRRRLALVGAVLLAAACVERLTAPGQCPDFCPSGQITIVDTLLTSSIHGDSSFRGYVLAQEAAQMLAAHIPGATDTLDGRPIFRINGYGSRFRISSADTSTGPILGADSARLKLVVLRRDTATHNLRLQFYRLPITIDSGTTFGSVAAPFTDSLVRTVNIDTLLAQPGRKDPVTGDSVVSDDTVSHQLVVSLKLDTAAARYVATDSGTVAYGIRVAADSLASLAIGEGTLGPALQRYLRVDSLGTTVARTPVSRG